MSTLTCPQCGKSFECLPHDAAKRKYCSNACSNKSRATTPEPKLRICPICHKTFMPSRNKPKTYCSRSCYTESRKKSVFLICQQCGTSFKCLPKDATRRKYCSYACNNKSRAITPEPKPRICPTCHEAFIPDRNKPETYCSRQCFLQAIRQGCERICKECGKEFLVPVPSREGIYCSRECLYAACSGPNHYKWNGGQALDYGPNWPHISAKTRERDSYICQRCGRHCGDDNKQPDVHHLIPLSTFDGDLEAAHDPSNLVTLCHGCHSYIERTSDPVQSPLTIARMPRP